MSTRQSNQPRLLSVEDNPGTRVLLEHLLGDTYRVTTVPCPEKALNAIAANPPYDLLLLDIALGAADKGTELLHEIRAREESGRIPAIAVTAYTMPGDEEELLSIGFDEYVGKPFTKAELTAAIEETLDGG